MGMRGTFLHGRGMYEGKEKELIFTIAERKDLRRLKAQVLLHCLLIFYFLFHHILFDNSMLF